MKIRPAKVADLDGMTRCARDFFEYAKFAEDGMPLCENSFKDMVAGYIQSGVVLLLVNDADEVKGGIAGTISPLGFNRSIKMMYELFFWIDPDARGIYAEKMLHRFENASRALGANFVVMASVATHIEAGVARLYQKMGYKYAEQFYRKGIK